MHLNAITCILVDTEEKVHREEEETRIGVMWSQAKEHMEPPEAGRTGKGSPPEPLESLWAV